MRLLLTGASSFTGTWFAQALCNDGHEVIAPLRGGLQSSGDPLRATRIARLEQAGVTLVPDCPFGSAPFLDLAGAHDVDVLCHHAADVTDYRSPDFVIARAVAANTANVRQVLDVMARRGLKRLVLTGSFFEAGEGAGSTPLRAFSPYAVSKGLTAEVVRFYCTEAGIPLGKFVIPHPFGPLEQPRFGAYLATTWRGGGTAEIRTPAYIRDNIHVSLLAAAYARFVSIPATGDTRLNPSGYIESQGAFVERIAREVRARTGLACKISLMRQQDFPEPLIRINTDPAAHYVTGWDESAAWDAYAAAIAGTAPA